MKALVVRVVETGNDFGPGRLADRYHPLHPPHVSILPIAERDDDEKNPYLRIVPRVPPGGVRRTGLALHRRRSRRRDSNPHPEPDPHTNSNPHADADPYADADSHPDPESGAVIGEKR